MPIIKRFDSTHGDAELAVHNQGTIISVTRTQYSPRGKIGGYTSSNWQMTIEEAEALGRNLLDAVADARAPADPDPAP